MKGKKICPECSTIVAARASSCLCGHSFFEKKTPPPKSAPQSAGRGRKQCPSCKVFCGVRVQKCNCGYEFVSISTAIAKVPKLSSEGGFKRVILGNISERKDSFFNPLRMLVAPNVSIDIGLQVSRVITPNGVCPVPLKDFSEDGILKWAATTFNVFKERNHGANLSIEALEYFSRQFTQGDFVLKTRVSEVLMRHSI